MTVGQLIALLEANDVDKEVEIVLEVGGDGAIHTSRLVKVVVEELNEQVILSGES